MLLGSHGSGVGCLNAIRRHPTIAALHAVRYEVQAAGRGRRGLCSCVMSGMPRRVSSGMAWNSQLAATHLTSQAAR